MKDVRICYTHHPSLLTISLLAGFSEMYGTTIASPGIAEKGFMNVLVEVTAPGGHSSIPPAHTVGQFLICKLLSLFTIFSEHRYTLCPPCPL